MSVAAPPEKKKKKADPTPSAASLSEEARPLEAVAEGQLHIHALVQEEVAKARYWIRDIGNEFLRDVGKGDLDMEALADFQTDAHRAGKGMTFFLRDEHGDNLGLIALQVQEIPGIGIVVVERALCITSRCRNPSGGFRKLIDAALQWADEIGVKKVVMAAIYGGRLKPEIVGRVYSEVFGFRPLENSYILER